MSYIRIKNPGNYPLARIEYCGDGCCSEIVWENTNLNAGEEFEEWKLDTAFMSPEDYEQINQ